MSRPPPVTDFRAFYDTWVEDVCRWVRALGGPDADVDDVVQEVFLIARRRLPSFDGRNPGGWLYQITRRQVRDFRRRVWAKHIFNRWREDDPDLLPDVSPHVAGGPAAQLEAKEERRVLYALLGKIPPRRRATFVLFELKGLSGEEIARIQSTPLNTIRSRLYQARREFFGLAARYQLRHRGQPEKRQLGEA